MINKKWNKWTFLQTTNDGRSEYEVICVAVLLYLYNSIADVNAFYTIDIV